ncbi:MAG: hypothetical protein RIS34_666 [Pseudomonadota bacterium]|jgi:hypothetical protein
MPGGFTVTEAELPESAGLPERQFVGREAFSGLIRDAFACAAREGWPEMILSDATFEDWPLRDRAVVDSLCAWSKTGRRLTLLAAHYDVVLRNYPRFVVWRKTWSHIIDCRVCRTADTLDFPSVLWSRNWALQRLDLNHSSGTCGSSPERRVKLKESLAERLRNSVPGFPASILGL